MLNCTVRFPLVHVALTRGGAITTVGHWHGRAPAQRSEQLLLSLGSFAPATILIVSPHWQIDAPLASCATETVTSKVLFVTGAVFGTFGFTKHPHTRATLGVLVAVP